MAYGDDTSDYISAPRNDKRCTYRIIKKWNNLDERYYYYPQYKSPNGWFWWGIEHMLVNWEMCKECSNEAEARTACINHAYNRDVRQKRLAAMPSKSERVPTYINLGKLP